MSHFAAIRSCAQTFGQTPYIHSQLSELLLQALLMGILVTGSVASAGIEPAVAYFQ